MPANAPVGAARRPSPKRPAAADQSATYKQPKSGRARTVHLSPELLRLGTRQVCSTFVYTREDGSPVQPRTLSQTWQLTLASSKLPRIRLHDLRHAHATHLLASCVHPKVACEQLGHSKVGITLDPYSHVLPGMQADAAARVDEAMRQAIDRRSKSDVG